MFCWFSPVPPSCQSTTISCQTLPSSSLTSQTGSRNQQGSERKRSQPDDAPPADHEALNKNSRWPGLELGTSSLQRYLSGHIWTVSKSVRVCTKTPSLCSPLNNLQYSMSLNTAYVNSVRYRCGLCLGHPRYVNTEVFPCFFLSCKANARVILAKTGHGSHSSKLVVIVFVLSLLVLLFMGILYYSM
jgi:hypothetical protein